MLLGECIEFFSNKSVFLPFEILGSTFANIIKLVEFNEYD